MPHITIEYVIMMPLLLLQIFLFPLTASWLMNTWVDSRRTLALQDVAEHLASTMQQLYFTLNHATVPAEKTTYSPGLPTSIEGLIYTANASIYAVLNPDTGSSKALELTVRLPGTPNYFTTTVLLGPNADWNQSVFLSNSTRAGITGQKFMNGTDSWWISLQFES